MRLTGDIRIIDYGSDALFWTITDEARDWINSHVYDPMYYGSALVVEHRYVNPLIEGMLADDLVCVLRGEVIENRVH